MKHRLGFNSNNKLKQVFQFRWFGVVCCLLVGFQLQAQKLVYNAYLEDKKIGQLTVTKEELGNAIHIHSITKLQAKIPLLVTVELDVKSSYLNGVLIESKAISTRNGKIHSTIEILKTTDGYQLVKDEESSLLTYSDLKGADYYYFKEPEKRTPVIALASGDLYEIKTKPTPGSYVFVRNRKEENRVYLNGTLQEVNIEHLLYTVILKLVQ